MPSGLPTVRIRRAPEATGGDSRGRPGFQVLLELVRPTRVCVAARDLSTLPPNFVEQCHPIDIHQRTAEWRASAELPALGS